MSYIDLDPRVRISNPDLNPDHAQLWTRSSFDHYLPTHQISSKSDL